MGITFLDEDQKSSSISFSDEPKEFGNDAEIEKRDKKYLAEQLGIPQFAEDAVVGPIVETLRGFSSGTSSFYGKLNSVSKFVENTTGIPEISLFKNWEESTKNIAESIPETKQNPFNKFVFQAAGETIPIMSEFALTKGGNIAKFATLEAIEEYGKLEDPNFIEGSAAILKGSLHGATVGMAFSAAPALFTKAKEVLSKAGKSAAKNFMTFITGNKELSKNFVKNPNKYSVFKKYVKTSNAIKEENKLVEQELKKKHRVEKESFKFKQDRDKLLIREQLKDSKNRLSEARTETINDMGKRKKSSLESIIKTNDRVIQNSNQALNQNATNFMDNTLNKYKLLRQQKGEAVGEAIRIASENNPGASIPFSSVEGKIRSAIKKSPFQFAKRSSRRAGLKQPNLLEPTTAISADANDVKQINALMNEIGSKRGEGFPILYLQDLKKAAQQKAAQAHQAGKNELRIFWQDIAKSVNPANIITSDKALSKQFSNIAKANKEFSTFIKQYDRAMDGYYKKNALGEYIPDVNKALTAVVKGDKATIREMKIADMALPKEDRILPEFQKLLQGADDIATKQKANYKLVKHRFEAEERAFKKSSKKAINNLTQEQRFTTQTEKQRGITKLREFIESQEDEYNAIRNKLEEAENFYKAQETLRQFQAEKGAAYVIQHILGFSGVAPVFTGRAVSVPALAGFFALSPKVASPTIKGALKAGQVIGRGAESITPILREQAFQQVGGTKILMEND